MKLTQIGRLIRIDFQFNLETVARVGLLPGAKFNKDETGAYWTIPTESANHLLKKFSLSPGFLYPGCENLLDPNYYGILQVRIKEDRILIEGQNAAWMSQSILDLCSFENTTKKIEGRKSVNITYYESLAEEIYAEKTKGIKESKTDSKTVVVKFPPGLYWRVLGFVKKFNIGITVCPYPDSPELDSNIMLITPRPYQIKTTDEILSGKIPNKATLVMATGAGKTILACGITAALGLNTIFYTYSTDLLEQTAEAFEQALETKIGRVSGEYFDIQPITVATVQMVHSCYEQQDARWNALSKHINSAELMFIDEGHMLGAKTIFMVSQITNAYYSYALTATPERDDGKELLIEAGTGPAVKLISEKELIEQGYILPVEIDIYKVPAVECKSRRYNTAYSKQIVNNNYRNNMIADIAGLYRDKQVIILVKEITHGQNLEKLISAPFIHGESKNRKEVLQAFKEKKISTIIASNILKQGIDIPAAEVLILAHGGAGKVELQQKIGRVRRPYYGKTKGIVIDFYDSLNVFAQQAEKRIAFYKSVNHPPLSPLTGLEVGACSPG